MDMMEVSWWGGRCGEPSNQKRENRRMPAEKMNSADSRDYVVAFAVNQPREIPADFLVAENLTGLKAGVFLPGADPNWRGHRSYPARLLLLLERELLIIPHPASSEHRRRIPITALEWVESGRWLLKSWIRLQADPANEIIPYNARVLEPVSRWLMELRESWQGEDFPDGRTRAAAGPRGELRPTTAIGAGSGYPPGSSAQTVTVGPRLDLKFQSVLQVELDQGETPLLQWFQPPAEVGGGRWLRAGKHVTGGELLLFTPRRLLWISDRDGRRRVRYGWVARYTRRGSITGAALESDGNHVTWTVRFPSGSRWLIPVNEGRRTEAKQFQQYARRLLSGQTTEKAS